MHLFLKFIGNKQKNPVEDSRRRQVSEFQIIRKSLSGSDAMVRKRAPALDAFPITFSRHPSTRCVEITHDFCEYCQLSTAPQ